jgi:hypothetical protein
LHIQPWEISGVDLWGFQMHGMTCDLVLVCWSSSYSDLVDIERHVDEVPRNKSLRFAARPLTVAESAIPYLPRIAIIHPGPADELPLI